MGRRIELSNGRRATIGMLRYCERIPSNPVARFMSLADLVEARRELRTPPSWSAIFIRAYGIVCSQFAPLRRALISWPSPYLYENEHSGCAVAVERAWQGESIVLFGQIAQPENLTMGAIQRALQHFQEADVWSVGTFRLALRFGRLPSLLQRLLLWHKLDVSGRRRIKYMGTFGMTNYGMLGAESLHPLGPQSTVLTLGPLAPNGDITVKLVYDHRVLDGAYVARCLQHLEDLLHTTILDELAGHVDTNRIIRVKNGPDFLSHGVERFTKEQNRSSLPNHTVLAQTTR
jgi:hypothetical protein